MAGLRADLVSTTPDPLRVGRGTALFVKGSFELDPGRAPSALTLALGERTYPADFAGSEFWAVLPVAAPPRPATNELTLRAEISGAAPLTSKLAQVALEPEPGSAEPLASPPGWPAGGSPVAICMATHEPDVELFERQLESIREQTHEDWICVISDDRSSPEALAEIERVIGADPRFLLSAAPAPLGFYRNFERALSLAPAEAAYLALADQDDRWYPHKLEVLLEAFDGGALLAHSEMRIVGRGGEQIAASYWPSARQATPGLSGLIAANSVTGAASLFSRRLLADVLPFPPRSGPAFHDHWIALVAAARDGIRFVERPLQDYVQHPGSVAGHESAKPRRQPRSRRERVRGAPAEAPAMYFDHYCQRAVFCRALLERGGPNLSRRARRTLNRFLAADRQLGATAWLTLWALASLPGRSDRAGMIRALGRGVVWARLARFRARRKGRGQVSPG